MLPVKRNTQHWLPSLFSDFFGNPWIDTVTNRMPAINIKECDKCYTVELAAPGLKKEDLKVYVDDDNRLVISVHTECESEKENDDEECKEEKCDNKWEGEKCRSEKEKDSSLMGKCNAQNTKKDGSKYLRREFCYSQFRQTLLLPDNVDRDQIMAKAKNGILTIKLPKKLAGAVRVAKQIDVE